MEITVEMDDDNLGPAVEEWADNNFDSRFEACIENHDFSDSVDVEATLRELLDDFTPGGGGCATARVFEEAVNGILDHRGEIVIKQNVDGITGEVRDALAEMVAKEVETQVSVMVVNIQRGLRRLHERNPEVAGSI